jgi:hypothetical protein
MELEKTLMQLFESIEDCLLKHRLLPCLILLYSAIDIVSSLESVELAGGRCDRSPRPNLIQN